MADYEGVLAHLKVRREAIEREHAELDTAISALERLSPSSRQKAGSASQGEVRTVSPRTFIGSTMPQAIAKFLKQAQEPQTKSQIKEALRAGGMKAGSSFGSHIYNTLHRLSKPGGQFRREADGRWGLREWPTERSPAEAGERPA